MMDVSKPDVYCPKERKRVPIWWCLGSLVQAKERCPYMVKAEADYKKMEARVRCDFIKKEWVRLRDFISPLSKDLYTIWGSPDNKFVASIHEADGEIAGVSEVETGKIVYEHPKTAIGRKMLIKFRERRS